MDKGPSTTLLKAMKKHKPPPVSPEKLVELRELVKRARVLDVRIENGNGLLKTLKAENNKLKMEDIPTLMEGIGIKSLVVEGEGNEPPFSAVNKQFFSAGLPESMDEAKRQEAFDYLTSIGHGDLIKQEVSFLFPINTDQRLIELFILAAQRIKVGATGGGKGNKPKLEIPIPTTSRSVHSATLTAWLKRQVQSGFVPALDKIGGFVGRKVEIKTVEN
jgi:hypothetical protein